MRPAEKPTAKTTFIYFAILAILVALIFNLLAGPIPLKHPPLHLKHIVCKEKGLPIHIKIAFQFATLI